MLMNRNEGQHSVVRAVDWDLGDPDINSYSDMETC